MTDRLWKCQDLRPLQSWPSLVRLISNELIQWSQTARDTNNNISPGLNTPHTHHSTLNMKVGGKVFPSEEGISKQQQTEGLILSSKVTPREREQICHLLKNKNISNSTSVFFSLPWCYFLKRNWPSQRTTVVITVTPTLPIMRMRIVLIMAMEPITLRRGPALTKVCRHRQ